MDTHQTGTSFALGFLAGGHWVLEAFLPLGNPAKPAARTQPCSRRPVQTARGFSHLISIKLASDAGLEWSKLSCEAICELNAGLNPSSRNVPALLKSGPGSCVWSCQSPVDATLSALVRAARSNGGEHLGRSSGPASLCHGCQRPYMLLLL